MKIYKDKKHICVIYMKNFKCHKCTKAFTQQSHLDNHLNKKNPCDKILKKSENLSTEKIDSKKMRECLNELKCAYCDKEFSRKGNVLYHIEHNCKRVKEIEEEKNKIFIRLKAEEEKQIKLKEEENDKIKLLVEENQKLKNALENKDKELEKKLEEKLEKKFDKKLQQELSKLKKSVTKVSHKNSHNTAISNSNNTDNSINDSSIQQNIFLANYTGSGMPPIPQEEIIPLLKRGFQTSVELTKKIHFNPKYPEYHNVFIPRINEKYGMIYVNDNWKITDRDELVNDIYENKRAYVIENLDTFINKLDENKKKSLKRWLDKNDDDDESVINTKEDIKRVLFDNRHMAMARKKELERQNKKKLEYVSLSRKQPAPVIEEYKSEESSETESSDSSQYSNYSYVKSGDEK
jgi:hypothetical protein